MSADPPAPPESPDAPLTHSISTPPIAQPEGGPRSTRLRRFTGFLWRRAGTIVLGVAGVAAAVPLVLYLLLPTIRMHVAWTDSAACVAQFERPRGGRLPNCASFIHDYEHLADYGLTRHDATYRAEELWARIMMASYLNAAIGAPSSSDRARTSAYVGDAQGVLERGSQRISLDELGPAVMAPNQAKFANAVGDRATLIGSYEAWSLWTSRQQAIRAALLEANIPTATTIAASYAELEPREADLRTTIGAVMCLGPKPSDGVDFLERVPTDRYDKRYASIQRDYGEVLGVLKACAKRADRPPPPLPPSGSAGVADMKEARLVEAIRLTSDPLALGDTLDRAVVALESEEGVEDRKSRWARAYLLAALVARDADAPAKPVPAAPPEKKKAPTPPKDVEVKPDGDDGDAEIPKTDDLKLPLYGSGGEHAPIANRLDPKLLANFARPRAKETALAPPPSHVLSRILDEGYALTPILPAETLATASEKLEKIAASATDPKADPTAPPLRPLLEKAAGSLAMHAGMAAARFGAPPLAEAEMQRAARLLGLDDATGRVLAASAVYVAGDGARALVILGDTSGAAPAVEMEAALLRARLLAPTDGAAALEQVKRALALAERADDPVLAFEARWMETALAPRGAASGPLLFPVYTGQADIDGRGFTRFSRPALDRNFEAWARAISGSGEEQLAFRYKLFHQAGDAPQDLGMYLLAGSRVLADADADATEVWLDAMTALDRERFTLFAYAFGRLEAARFRGDAASAAQWKDRLDGIRAVKGSPDYLEIARFLNY